MLPALQPAPATQLTKKEACAFLGKSPRSIAVYVSEGKLPKHINRGAHGFQAMFERSDLERLKDELERPLQQRSASLPALPAIAAQATQVAMVPASVREEVIERVIGAIAARGPSLSDLAAKIVLTLDDAKRLSGVSRSKLRDAIEAGSLKARKDEFGRGWRMKRSDLERYVSEL